MPEIQAFKYDFNFIQRLSFERTHSIARDFYFSTLMALKVAAPVFNGELVTFTHTGWNHFSLKHRSVNELITRFFALPRVPHVLLTASRIKDYEVRNTTEITEYWVLEQVVQQVSVKVIVSAINGGEKHFLSCMWKGQSTKHN